MTTPNKERWFDHFKVGEVFEFGDCLLEEADIVAFARQFDPQPFHIDADAAARSIFGGLIASGWHTTALMMRMMVDHFISPDSSMGSPGMDEVRWLRPVRPGDRLRVRLRIAAVKASTSKPDRGVVHEELEVLNQHNDVVMTCRGMGIYRREPTL